MNHTGLTLMVWQCLKNIAGLPSCSLGSRILMIAALGCWLIPSLSLASPETTITQAKGPLRVLKSNPRYFSDQTGKAVYLTGMHIWNNFQDWSGQADLDYTAYLQRLESYNHNFIRMWTWEHAPVPPHQGEWPDAPSRYQRTGPETDFSGEPKFDLTKFNQEYFDRLRARVQAAQDRGIYASVMLFQGGSIEGKGEPVNPWLGHPFNVKNNVNGIDGDLDHDGEGKEVHTLRSPAVTAVQEAYVGKVIDTLNDFDNVLYEISNESHRDSQEWQYHLIRYIKQYEAGKPKQHPVGMTVEYPYGDNAELFSSPADWISPNEWAIPGRQDAESTYKMSPPPADGRKVVLADTDHLWGLGGTPEWVWKSFTRGYQAIFMDLDEPRFAKYQKPENRETWDSTRRAMGHILGLARRIPLQTMLPATEIASSGYCLTNRESSYVVYLPLDYYGSTRRTLAGKVLRFLFRKEMVKKIVSVDLSAATGPFLVEWLNVSTGESVVVGTTTGGSIQNFGVPFDGAAVLYLSTAK